MIELQGGTRYFYLVTDLTGLILRKGVTANQTLAAGAVNGSVVVNLSPPLPSPFLSSQYHVLLSCEIMNGTGAVFASYNLFQTQLTITFFGQPDRVAAPGVDFSGFTTDSTISPEPDTGHLHTTVSLTLPTVNLDHAGAETVKIHWVILKA